MIPAIGAAINASCRRALQHIRSDQGSKLGVNPPRSMLMVGTAAFGAATLLYSSRGPDSGAVQFFLYGLVGLVPATLSSWLSHKYVDEAQPAVKA